jgi:competence protein ComGC
MATWSVELLLVVLLLLVLLLLVVVELAVASQEARGGRLVVRSLRPSWQHWRQRQ